MGRFVQAVLTDLVAQRELYAKRIRAKLTDAKIAEAEQLLRRITEQYFSSNLTVEEMRALASLEEADPLKAFGEACRAEIKSMRAEL